MRYAACLIVISTLGLPAFACGQPAGLSRGASQQGAKLDSGNSARASVYNPQADAKTEIAEAVAKARRNNQRVLVKWGGNWCSWCYKLHDVFVSDAAVAPVMRDEYVLVMVDGHENQDLLEQYDPEHLRTGFPFLTVLDGEGKVVVNQRTAVFEDGPTYDVAKVKQFLEQWKAQPPDAEEVVRSALARARADGKQVLLHFGAPWCGWCHRLDEFLERQAGAFSGDYVIAKVDTERMAHGQDVMRRLRPEGSQGIPWMTIVDGDGRTLVTADGPSGNIGFPVTDEEIAYFISMLEETGGRSTRAQIPGIRLALESSSERAAAR